MNNKVIVAIVLLLTVLGTFFLVLDIDSGKDINKTFDKTGQKIELTVHFFDTEKELEKALLDRLGKPFQEFLDLKKKESKNTNTKISLEGQAIFSPDDNICEIYMYRPKKIDDNNTLTLGHEVLHCIYGSYHSELTK